MICPKCGRPVDASAVICFGCDFILDTAFLGDEILDEEQSLRPGMGGVDPAVFNLADAVILGDIDDQAQSFETSDSGFHVRESTGARLYVSGRSQAMMAPDAVPAIVDQDLAGVRLTPFEKHVLSFIDGKRPVEIIRMRAGLDESEVKTALATLADKGVVEVVGRALVETDPFQETAQRRQQKPRRSSGLAGAVAAALGPIADETDRAIEEAFRTATGLSPLAVSDLAPPPEEDNVFSSLSGDPLAELARSREAARGPLTSKSDLSAVGEDSDVPRDTAFTERPADDDLPSDADSFDVLAHTSEIERSPALEERLRAYGTVQRGGLGPMATNARRVLSDREIAEILDEGDGSADTPSPVASTRVGERPSALESAGASDGFDDFGEASELNTALLPGMESSLSQAPPGSEVFKSATGTVSLPAMGERPKTARIPGGIESFASADGSRTGIRPQLADESSSLSDLLDDDVPLPEPSITPAPASVASPPAPASPFVSAALAPREGPSPREDLGDGGDLADLVGDAPSFEGTDTSKAGPPVESAQDVHSAITAAPALQVSASEDEESLDPFAGIDLERSDESEDERSPDESVHSQESAAVVQVASEDMASSDEGTAVYAKNPFASDPDVDDDDDGHDAEDAGEAGEHVSADEGIDDAPAYADDDATNAHAQEPPNAAAPEEDDEDDPVTYTVPVPHDMGGPSQSSEVSAVFELADESEGGLYDDDAEEDDDFYEAATDGVPAEIAAAALARGSLADAFSDEDAAHARDLDEDFEEADGADDYEDDYEEPPTARGFEDPRNRPPTATPDIASVSTKAPEPSASSGPSGELGDEDDDGDEEIIDDALIIRPAAPTMQVRGASVLEELEERAPREEAIGPGASLSAALPPSMAASPSQETAYLERPEEIAALQVPPSGRSRAEATALFSEVGDALDAGRGPSPASELSQGGAWASSEEADEAEAYGSDDDRPYDDAPEDVPSEVYDASDDESQAERGYERSSDSTQVLSGSRRAAPGPSAPEAHEPPRADADETAPPVQGSSRNDPEAMREKARKLFEDALRDYREGRIGAARMNAKLATIYDPANEEYRAALEQWGKGGRRRVAQQPASYAALYDEAQEREGAGDVEGAITLLLQGAERFPEIAAIQNRLGVLLAIHKREYERASAYIQRAIELDPDNLHYKSNLGKILSRKRQRQQRANG